MAGTSRVFRPIVWAYPALAALALANSGCLLVAAGAAGGAAAGYAYCKGKVCGLYNSSYADTWAATHTALAELGMTVIKEEQHGGSGSIHTRTADGERLRIYLDTETSKFPAEGPLTRVCVRVATFGDRPVSDRVLDQIGFHLAPLPTAAAQAVQPFAPGVVQQTGGTAPPSQANPPAATSPQTTPPPLLPPEPRPVK